MPEVFDSLEALPPSFGPCALTIGNFDGVHAGHQRILEVTAERARANGWRAAALTFEPHPLKILAPERAPLSMMTLGQRLRRMGECGIETVVVLAFTPELSRTEPEEFVDRVLAGALGARWVVVGENFRFGRRHAGDVDTLERLGGGFGFRAEAVEPVVSGGEVVSSTRIRQAVAAGRVVEARRLLGHPFAIAGEVQPGRGIGARSTVPTLNLAPESELLPFDGVYVSETCDRDTSRLWRSISNVGVRPTFGGGERTVETHLLDPFDGRAPSRIEVTFHRRLRAERRFESAAALKEQIVTDIARTQRFFRLLDAVSAEPAESR